jgi:hypothetical protein
MHAKQFKITKFTINLVILNYYVLRLIEKKEGKGKKLNSENQKLVKISEN